MPPYCPLPVAGSESCLPCGARLCGLDPKKLLHDASPPPTFPCGDATPKKRGTRYRGCQGRNPRKPLRRPRATGAIRCPRLRGDGHATGLRCPCGSLPPDGTGSGDCPRTRASAPVLPHLGTRPDPARERARQARRAEILARRPWTAPSSSRDDVHCLGLLSLAAVLKAAGREVRVVDLPQLAALGRGFRNVPGWPEGTARLLLEGSPCPASGTRRCGASYSPSREGDLLALWRGPAHQAPARHARDRRGNRAWPRGRRALGLTGSWRACRVSGRALRKAGSRWPQGTTQAGGR